MTEGDYRVGRSFNPSKNIAVDHLKTEVAALIDYIQEFGKDARCTALAQTELESACMWAVKSVTKQPKE